MERNKSIDIAKGIGILLVVWGHFLAPNPPLFREIFYFHMPLFFIMAGCFHKDDWSTSSVLKRIKRLLMPVLIFSLFFLGVNILKTQVGVILPLKSVFTGFDINKPLQFVDPPLWFLVVLVFDMLFCIVLNKCNISKIWKLIVALLIGYLGVHTIQLPIYLTQALATFVFYYCGYELKNFILQSQNYKMKLFCWGGRIFNNAIL